MDNELSFRALEASGERNIPCGFDVKALEILFPEEMNAYRRWKTVSTLLFWFTLLIFYPLSLTLLMIHPTYSIIDESMTNSFE